MSALRNVGQIVVLMGVFGASAWVGRLLFGAGDDVEARALTENTVARPAANDAAPRSPAPPEGDMPLPLPGLDGPVGDTDGGGSRPVVEDVSAPVRLTFEDLSQWDLDPENVQVPQSIQMHHGKRVDIVGFMIPYGDPDNVEEFLLVQDLGSCCFGAVPQPHHLVECKVVGGKSVRYAPGTMRIRGKFVIKEHREGKYLISVYSMEVEDAVEVR